MEFSPRAAELTTLLESRISNFNTNFQVDEIGRVVSVGDGIARVYGLNEIQAGEMVEFASGVKGIALNLENENVGIVVFGSDTAIKEGDLVKRTGSIVDVPAGKAMLGRVVDALGVPIDGRGALSDHERRRVEVKAPGIIERKPVHEPTQTGKRAKESYIVVSIKRSPGKLLGPDVFARLSGLFSSRAVVLSENSTNYPQQYRIGVWAKAGESKRNYKKAVAAVFPEISPENLFSEKKKGLGGWASFLCNPGYEVLFCSGELSKRELFSFYQNFKKKKKLKGESPSHPERGKARAKKGERREKAKAGNRSAFPAAITNLLVKVAVALLKIFLKLIRATLWLVYNKVVGYLVILSLSFYVWVYKGAIHLTPEHLEVMDRAAFQAWILDWKTPGLPKLPSPPWYMQLWNEFFYKIFPIIMKSLFQNFIKNILNYIFGSG